MCVFFLFFFVLFCLFVCLCVFVLFCFYFFFHCDKNIATYYVLLYLYNHIAFPNCTDAQVSQLLIQCTGPTYNTLVR